MPPADDSCDPALRSWIASANSVITDFPIQNLPLGIVRRRDSGAPFRCGVAIGDRVLDVGGCAEQGLLALAPAILDAVTRPTLNALLALGMPAVGALRRAIQRLLLDDTPAATKTAVAKWLLDADAIESRLPIAVGDFTDFFASAHHALNVARLRVPDATLRSHYTHYAAAPLAYQGRSSSLIVDGTAVPRPWGPRRAAPSGSSVAVYQPTRRLDYEAELGLVIGGGSTFGRPVRLREARSLIAGVCLLNDWSARDIQGFESQPLGPFLSKSFATSLSPWIVTTQALEPFRVAAAGRNDAWGHDETSSEALPHLQDDEDRARGAWSIALETWLTSRTMREMAMAPIRLSRVDARTLFWTPAQLVAHQTANGCPLSSGDLLGTGTISGPAADEHGCLLELTRGGRAPITLPTGESRGYLDDDDEVTLRAVCEAPGAVRIGFGECRGRVVPAHTDL